MYGSYGSYSSMGSITMSAPMDITSSNMLAHDRSCAFPSWPRRDSLSSAEAERPTSYLSDDDLFPSDPFEDDTHSVTSAGSCASPSSHVAEDEMLLQMERERQRHAAMEREAALRHIMNEKERRRTAMAMKRRAAKGSSSSSKKSPKSKLISMTPISE
ncbi:hypothetical protein ACHAQA_007374 [Verticillium albo-atrum]